MPTFNERLQIKKIVATIENFVSRIIRKLTFDMHANLVEDTPVDTGWARANWLPSLEEPRIVDLEGFEATIQDAVRQRSRTDGDLASLVAYEIDDGVIFITNNVPYIVLLNEGSSTQAPSAFVQAAIRRAILNLGRT
jgi:hypothetical protein